MANNKPSYTKVTLKGTAKYPRLNQPDTKFNPGGDFSVKLIVAEADATPLMETISAEIDKAYEAKIAKMQEENKSPALIKKVKKADPPYVEVYDEDGNATGELQFNFKMKHTLTLKDGTVEKRWPVIVDSKGNKLGMYPGHKDETGKVLPKAPSIWGGSVLTVKGQLVPFDSPVAGCGVSLRLSAAQINKLVSGGGGSYGFEEDGDYEAGEAEEDTSFSDSQGSEQSSASEEDNEDF